MAYLRDRVIVLVCTPFREHDAWITAFGEEHGKLSAVARGYFRKGAKQFGHLEPLQCAEVMIAKGSAFDKLAVARAVSSSDGLRASLPGLVLAGAMATLVEELTRPGIAEPEVFALLYELTQPLFPPNAVVSAERVRLVFASCGLRLLDSLGYRPQLEQCALCSTVESESWWVSPQAGGLVCVACARRRRFEDLTLQPLSEKARRVLRFLRQATLPDLLGLTAPRDVLQEVGATIEHFLLRLPISQAFSTIDAMSRFF